ncbi:MAG: F0F1 ATP synthase subunit delta [Prevotellaceae bacterium]|nr:F0F1 ATP synthase subunit delta [Prevotellaceae bacterium]
MDLGLISVRYARALLKCSLEQKVEDAVYDDMLTLSKSFASVPQLSVAIANPMMQREEKAQLIETAMGGNPNELSKKFVTLVLSKERVKHLMFMASSYITLYRKHKNITSGKLTTATPVSQQTEAKMKQMVESKTNGTVEFETVVDPEIIGGFILEYDTYRMDSSVQNALRTISAQLK